MYDRGRPSAPCPLCGTGPASPTPDRLVKSGSRSRSGRPESGSSESSQDSGHYDLRDDARGSPVSSHSLSGSDRLGDTVIRLPPLRSCLQETNNNNNNGGGPSVARKVKAVNGASRTPAYPGGGVLDTSGFDNAGVTAVTADLAALRFHEEMASSIRLRLARRTTSSGHPIAATSTDSTVSSDRTYSVASPAARPVGRRPVPKPTVSGGTPTLSKRSAKSRLDPTRQPLC